MSKYIALLKLPLNGKTYNVGFKKTGFQAPYAMRGPVQVEKLAEHDKALYESYSKANGQKKSNKEEEFKLTPIVAGFIKTAFEDGQVSETKGTALFDILINADYAEAALPPKAELDVQLREKASQLESAEEKIKALEAQILKTK